MLRNRGGGLPSHGGLGYDSGAGGGLGGGSYGGYGGGNGYGGGGYGGDEKYKRKRLPLQKTFYQSKSMQGRKNTNIKMV